MGPGEMRALRRRPRTGVAEGVVRVRARHVPCAGAPGPTRWRGASGARGPFFTDPLLCRP